MEVPLKNRRKESDAEHSWAVSLVACALAERIDKELDLGKIAQLSIVHDLVEVFAGDTSIWDTKGLASKVEREKQALAKLKLNFKQFPWIAQLAEEYESKKSKEAIFVWAVDKYVASFSRVIDLSRGGDFFKRVQPMSLAAFKQGIEPTRKKAHAHKKIGKYYDEMLSQVSKHPEWFAN